MFQKLMRAVICVAGFIVGPGVVALLSFIYEYFAGRSVEIVFESWFIFVIYAVSGIVSGIIFILLSKRIVNAISRGTKSVEKTLSGTSSMTLIAGAIGLIIGLVIAALISIIIGLIPVAWISVPLTIVDYLIFGYLGVTTGVKRKQDFANLLYARKTGKMPDGMAGEGIPPKILDTSVIIDGRIYDICRTGMFEGEMLVPNFVLLELQKIADSTDSMKRTRGRRGLDILEKMQKEQGISVRLVEEDYEELQEVDSKLLKLAKDMDGVLVTNDYNLNKVAAVQDVRVFNINELANAVKPILMAGEELKVAIVKDGKEQSQGIAYLDDGTMIVVDGAKGKTGKTFDVVVTSVLQTAAGRMIFARLKDGR